MYSGEEKKQEVAIEETEEERNTLSIMNDMRKASALVLNVSPTVYTIQYTVYLIFRQILTLLYHLI